MTESEQAGDSTTKSNGPPYGPAPGPVELRLHGVGGSTPEALLDVPSNLHLVRVAGGPSSAFYAQRKVRNVEGYVWGRLTSLAKLQPLWLLLLPFTLINVGGWMNRGDPDRISVRALRRTQLVLGYLLTITWAFWMCTIFIDRIGYQWGGAHRDVARLAAVGFVILFVLAHPFLIARFLTARDHLLWFVNLRRSMQATGAGFLVLIGVAVLLNYAGVIYVIATSGADSAQARLLVGAVLTLGALWFVFAIARHATRDYEEVQPPRLDASCHEDESGTPEDDPATARRFSGIPTLRLDDKDVWRQYTCNGTMRHRLYTHVAMALLTVFGISAFAHLSLPDDPVPKPEPLGTGQLLLPLLGVQLLCLLLLLLLSSVDVLGWLRSRPSSGTIRRSFRFAGPFAAAATAIGMTHSVFSGMNLWVAGILGLATTKKGTLEGRRFELVAPEQSFADVLGFSTLVAGLTIVAWFAWHWFFQPAPLAPVPSRQHPARELRGLSSEEWRSTVMHWRRFSNAGGNSGWILLLPSLAFFGYGIFKGWGRITTWFERVLASSPQGLGDVPRAVFEVRSIPLSCQKWWSWFVDRSCGGPNLNPRWLAFLGTGLVSLALPAGILFLRGAARRDSTRRGVGILWDVLTFWPRWFHPFAVRPYTERAVPELQHRLVHHTQEKHPVVISAHSQGSILAAAALFSLEECVTKRVALVTHGCPLSQLYGRFFPAYFERENQALRDKVERRWINFGRETDYIAKRVEVPGLPDTTMLDDPPTEPSALEIPYEPLPEISELEPWTRLNKHSHYRREKEVQAAVESFKAQLS